MILYFFVRVQYENTLNRYYHTFFRYSLGVHPISRLNCLLKFDKLRKPHSKLISETVFVLSVSAEQAARIRNCVIYSTALTPADGLKRFTAIQWS